MSGKWLCIGRWFCIDGNLTGHLYLQLLEAAIAPSIIAAIENYNIEYDPIFQPGNSTLDVLVRKYVDEEFPVIGLEKRTYRMATKVLRPRSP